MTAQLCTGWPRWLFIEHPIYFVTSTHNRRRILDRPDVHDGLRTATFQGPHWQKGFFDHVIRSEKVGQPIVVPKRKKRGHRPRLQLPQSLLEERETPDSVGLKRSLPFD
jgi:hypothetical protein